MPTTEWYVVNDSGEYLEAKPGCHWTTDVDKAYKYDDQNEAELKVDFLKTLGEDCEVRAAN